MAYFDMQKILYAKAIQKFLRRNGKDIDFPLKKAEHLTR